MIVPDNNFIQKFRETYGAMSVCEMIFLANCAFDAPEGTYLELGSHKGKSSSAIALFVDEKSKFHLVEPEFKDSAWIKEVATLVNSVRPNINIVLIPDYSTNVIPFYNQLAFVFVDSGNHQDGLPDKEVKMLEDRMKDGGIIVFHDYNSQFYEVTEAYEYLISTGKYKPILPDWSRIVKYVDENNLEQGNNTWHHTDKKNPCYIGALKRVDNENNEELYFRV